jgi:predicted nucleotidyltransferase
MQNIIKLLNEMKEKKIIEEYAIGGATALIYYFEPIQTQDIDVFIAIQSSGLLANLNPVYEFFHEKGGVVKNEYIVINNTPVQFLLPYNPLIESALKNSIQVEYMQEKVKIFSLEHLMAIMVQTSRGKDKARLEEIFQAKISFDIEKFQNLLKEFDLTFKWNKIQSGFDL